MNVAIRTPTLHLATKTMVNANILAFSTKTGNLVKRLCQSGFTVSQPAPLMFNFNSTSCSNWADCVYFEKNSPCFRFLCLGQLIDVGCMLAHTTGTEIYFSLLEFMYFPKHWALILMFCLLFFIKLFVWLKNWKQSTRHTSSFPRELYSQIAPFTKNVQLSWCLCKKPWWETLALKGEKKSNLWDKYPNKQSSSQ